MGLNDYKTGTINGSSIVRQYDGQSTGDVLYKTADGRYWTDLRGVVPTTLPTGSTIATIRK